MSTDPLRILFQVSRWGDDARAAGGDVQGALYARLLARMGHQVTYLTSADGVSPAREVRDGVRIVRLGRPEMLAARMWSYYRQHRDDFDIVYTEAFGGARVPFLAPLYVRQPVLTAWYQVNAPVFRHQYGRVAALGLTRLERMVARVHRRTTLLTPSHARRADLVDFGFSPEQVEVLPPFALQASAPPPGPAAREPLIVWLGKVRRYKCPHDAVAAVPRVLRERPDARLVIAGRHDDPAYERELADQVASLGIGHAVSFTFDISEADKDALLRRATAITLPSPIEGFGIVLLEAAACGTPAVVSDGVPEEVIEEGYNGLRVPFGDVEALGAAIARVLTSPELHTRLAAGALERAGHFTEERLCASLDRVVRGALGGTAARALVTAS